MCNQLRMSIFDKTFNLMKLKRYLLILAASFLFSEAVGQVVFQKSIGGTGTEQGYAVQQTSDKGYVVAGYTSSFGAGLWDVYLMKMDSLGDIIWTKTYGGTGSEYEQWAMDVKQTTDGGYVLVGHSESLGPAFSNLYVIKTDFNGNLLWSKTIYKGVNQYGYAVSQTSDGGYIIGGVSGGMTFIEFFVIKTDSNGDTLWTRTYGIPGNFQRAYFVHEVPSGGYIVAGNGTSMETILVRTDNNGDTLWTRKYSGCQTFSAKQTIDGGYVFAGNTALGAGLGDVSLMKTDSAGNVLWSKSYGGTDFDCAFSVDNATEGGYIITGWTKSFGAGDFDVYLIRVDSVGDTLWTKSYGTTDSETGFSVSQTTDGGYIIGAHTEDTLGFGWGDIYLIKTDSLGNTGCNQMSTNTIIGNIPITISSGLMIGSGAMVTNAATIVNNAFFSDSMLCSLSLSINVVDVSCNGICDGTAITIPVTGLPPFSYLWSTGPTSDSITGLCPGVYTVTVVDSNSDTAYGSVTVNEPLPLSIALTSTPAFGTNCDGTATSIPSGGTPPYTYQWDAPAGNQTTQTADSLCVGNYCVTVTDTNGCTVDTCISVSVGIHSIINNQSTITIYPNPFSTSATVEISNTEQGMINVEFILFDAFGRTLQRFEVQHSVFEIQRDGLPAGIYFYSIMGTPSLLERGGERYLGRGKLVIY